MSQEPFEALCARLERLEYENRRLKRVGAASLVVVALLCLGGAWVAEEGGVLKGEQIQLTNKAGDSRVLMGQSPEGLPAITLQRVIGEKAYSMRQELYVADDGTPILIFVDHTGTRRYKIPR